MAMFWLYLNYQVGQLGIKVQGRGLDARCLRVMLTPTEHASQNEALVYLTIQVECESSVIFTPIHNGNFNRCFLPGDGFLLP
jgi:hypothetical protein